MHEAQEIGRRMAENAAPVSPAPEVSRLSIAELVAALRANKEVAAALHLSAKTVENNLSRIYAKLGVRSRTELARVLADERDAAHGRGPAGGSPSS